MPAACMAPIALLTPRADEIALAMSDAPDSWASLALSRARSLAAHSSACVAQVEFCHTVEGGDADARPTSLRGLDAALYYRDPSGHGGLLALARPHVRRLALDALAHWASAARLDGFVLLSAEAMGLDPAGAVLDAPPLAAELAAAPELRGLKLVAWPRGDPSLLPRGGRRGFPHFGALAQHNARFAALLEWLGGPHCGGGPWLKRVAVQLTGARLR